MLKKPASGVLGSSKSSTYRFEILGGRKCWRGFSVRQDPLYGRTAPQSAVGTSSGFDSPAALLGTRRVSARRGWAGEKSCLFEHPIWYSALAINIRRSSRRIDGAQDGT